MDKLLNVDTGLAIWTIVTFLALIFVLKKIAWGPILRAIEEREAKLKADIEGAHAARAQAEKIKADLDAELAGLSAKQREMLAQTLKDAEALRAQMKAAAESDSQKIREKTMAELSDEKERLVRELRREVSGLSVLAAERLMRKAVDEDVQKTVLESFFKDLEGKRAN